MIKEFLAHIFISVDSKEHLSDEMIDAATKKFEESLAETLVQDDISDSVECNALSGKIFNGKITFCCFVF